MIGRLLMTKMSIVMSVVNQLHARVLMSALILVWILNWHFRNNCKIFLCITRINIFFRTSQELTRQHGLIPTHWGGSKGPNARWCPHCRGWVRCCPRIGRYLSKGGCLAHWSIGSKYNLNSTWYKSKKCTWCKCQKGKQVKDFELLQSTNNSWNELSSAHFGF